MVQGGSTFTDVLQTYSIATVGDGLVSQIPALLISTATSMIVTRAASEDSLNIDLTRQFKAQPMALIISGIVLIVLGLIPGFPKIQVFSLAVIFNFSGNRLLKGTDVVTENKQVESKKKKLFRKKNTLEILIIYMNFIQLDPIEWK